MVETARAWFLDPAHLRDQIMVDGLDVMRSRDSSRGCLLLCPHYSMLDLVAPLVSETAGEFVISYKSHPNPMMNRAIIRGRSRYGDLVDVKDLRTIVKRLKQGDTVWFGPDQDMGLNGSVFAPFFGYPAATVTTPSRLARLTGCDVVFLSLHRDSDGLYQMRYQAFDPAYPWESEKDNASYMNQFIERAILESPAQYMWMHKRFKTTYNGPRQVLYKKSLAHLINWTPDFDD